MVASLHATRHALCDKMVVTERDRRLAEKVNVARKMFYGGLALLPFLWLVNLIYFRRELWSKHTPPALKACTHADVSVLVQGTRADHTCCRCTDLHKSLVGFVVVTVLFMVWVVIFQESWQSWGDTGRDMLVVPPVSTFSCPAARMVMLVQHGSMFSRLGAPCCGRQLVVVSPGITVVYVLLMAVAVCCRSLCPGNTCSACIAHKSIFADSTHTHTRVLPLRGRSAAGT